MGRRSNAPTTNKHMHMHIAGHIPRDKFRKFGKFGKPTLRQLEYVSMLAICGHVAEHAPQGLCRLWLCRDDERGCPRHGGLQPG